MLGLNEAWHRQKVGERLQIVRTAHDETRPAWVKKYGQYLKRADTLSDWEGGLHYPPPLFLMRICRDYNVTLDWFYGVEPPDRSTET